MIPASKLIMLVHRVRCQANWASGIRTRCTQMSKYVIGGTYYCTCHAKIRALEEVLK